MEHPTWLLPMVMLVVIFNGCVVVYGGGGFGEELFYEVLGYLFCDLCNLSSVPLFAGSYIRFLFLIPFSKYQFDNLVIW